MRLKTFIFIITFLAIFEFLLHVVLFIFYIYQFMFGDYIEELWGKFGLDMEDEYEHGNFITDNLKPYLMSIIVNYTGLMILY